MTFKEGTDEPNKEQAMDYSPYGGVFWWLDYRERQRDCWVGKEKDRESGLGDHGVRKYDHLIGRFNSIDPLWSKYLGWTPYMYSANSPVYLKDVNGKNSDLKDPSNYNESGVNIGNTVYKLPDNNTYSNRRRKRKKAQGKNTEAGGFTESNQHIRMPKSQNNDENITHEIFHTLFF